MTDNTNTPEALRQANEGQTRLNVTLVMENKELIAEREALRKECLALRAAARGGAWVGYLNREPSELAAECEALRKALERISGFTMSQFASINDMALECVNVANDALAARAAKEQA